MNVAQRKNLSPLQESNEHWTSTLCHAYGFTSSYSTFNCSSRVLVSQWIERPSSVLEVMPLTFLSGTQIFSSFYACVLLITFHIFLFFHQFACSVKTKSLFLKMSQIYVVLLKEKNAHLSNYWFWRSRPFSYDFSKQLQR